VFLSSTSCKLHDVLFIAWACVRDGYLWVRSEAGCRYDRVNCLEASLRLYINPLVVHHPAAIAAHSGSSALICSRLAFKVIKCKKKREKSSVIRL